jgi:hypothetical protein
MAAGIASVQYVPGSQMDQKDKTQRSWSALCLESLSQIHLVIKPTFANGLSEGIAVNARVSQFEPEPLVKSICCFARGARSQIKRASPLCFCESYGLLGEGFAYTLLSVRFNHNDIFNMSP